MNTCNNNKNLELFNKINEISDPAYYQQIKLNIYKYYQQLIISNSNNNNNNSNNNNNNNNNNTTNNILSNSSNGSNNNNNIINQQIEIIRQIINEIGPCESILSTNLEIRMNFLNSIEFTNESNEIFDPLRFRIDRFTGLLKDHLQQTPIEPLLIDLINRYKSYPSQLIERIINKETTLLSSVLPAITISNSNGIISIPTLPIPKSTSSTSISSKSTLFKLLEPNPLIVSEDLIYREISLDKAYEIASYNPKEYEYVKKNENGTSIGGVVNGCYFKVDNGSSLLRPAKENAVYELYQNLFSIDVNNVGKDSLIAPTQLLVINQLPILPPDINESPERKELIKLKSLHGKSLARDIFNMDPTLERKIENALQNQRSLFIQGSLYIQGVTMLEFLQCQKLNPQIDYYSKLDRESFTSHIFASLLLLPTDYKPDNLIVQKDTNKIIGIDNDESMECDEVKKIISNCSNYVYTDNCKGLIMDSSEKIDISVKNILFTLPLMNEFVNDSIRLQFIQHHPNIFILEWLIQQLKKESTYKKLIKTSLPISTSNSNSQGVNNYNVSSLFIGSIKDNEDKIISNIYQDLGLPLKFVTGWIKEMLNRFILMKKLLKSTGTVTHQELLKQILPFTSYYYQALSRLDSDPIKQMAEIYSKEFDFKQLVSNYLPEEFSIIFKKMDEKQFTKSRKEPTQNLFETIKELIKSTNFNDFICNLDLIKWLETLFEYCNYYFNIDTLLEFNETWYENKKQIFKILVKNGASGETLLEFCKHFKLTTTEINSIKDDDIGSIIHIAINSNHLNLLSQIKMLHSFGVDIECDNGWSQPTPLGLSAQNKHFELFKLLLNLGAGSKTCYQKVNEYFKFLSLDLKRELRPHIYKLSFINPKIVWKISLDQLFPPNLNTNTVLLSSNGGNQSSGGNKVLKTTSEGERIISQEHWKQLFHHDGSTIKSNPHGSRSVPFVKSKGFRIYCKFEPQFPGIELAVTRLQELLFGYLSPYCELASINDIPVLLTQGITGDPLINVLNHSPSKLNLLCPSNISKQLVSAILFNPGDGNLGNYIVSPMFNNSSNSGGGNGVGIKNQEQYRIISIDQDQSFMPAISRELSSSNKLSLQVETVLFLFKQMNDPVHQDVVDLIVNKDIDSTIVNWLTNLKYHHQASINHFNKKCSNGLKKDSTIVGVPFAPGMIQQIFSKLTTLKAQLSIKRKKQITHIQLLEILEPMVAIRYKPLLLDQSENLIEKYNKLKQSNSINQSTDHTSISALTSSIHPSTYILESREIPTIQETKNHLMSSKFGPNEAIFEFEKIKKQKSKIDEILKSLGQFNNNNKSTDCNGNNVDTSSLSVSVSTTPRSLTNSGSSSSGSGTSSSSTTTTTTTTSPSSSNSTSSSTGSKISKLFRHASSSPISSNSYHQSSNSSSSSNDKKKELLADCLLEQLFREVDFTRLNASQEKSEFIERLKGRELKSISLKGTTTLRSTFFKSFISRSIVSMDLTNSSFDSISQIGLLGHHTHVTMPSLIQLRIDGCQQLFMLKLNAESLKVLSASDCSILKTIDLITPNLEYLNLENNSTIDLKVWDNITKNGLKLLKLNISNCKIQSNQLHFNFPSLIKLVCNHNIMLIKTTFQLPSVTQIHLENCQKLKYVTGSTPFLKLLNLNNSNEVLSLNDKNYNVNNPFISGSSNNNSGNTAIGLTSNNGSNLNNTLSSSHSITKDLNQLCTTTTITTTTQPPNSTSIYKVNVCGLDKHISYFRKLISSNSSNGKSLNYNDNINCQDCLFQFWYLPETDNSSTTQLYLRNSNLLVLFLDFSLIYDINDKNSINESLNVFRNYCNTCITNSISVKFIMVCFGYGYESSNNDVLYQEIQKFKLVYNIETFIYLPQIIEKYQYDFIKDSIFSNLRNDQLEICKIIHLYNEKKLLEKQKLLSIFNKLKSENTLIIQMLDLLEGLDFSDLIDHFNDHISSILEILEILHSFNKLSIEQEQQQQQQQQPTENIEPSTSRRKDFFKAKIIENQQQNILSKLERYIETMNIVVVFKNLKRLFYIGLINNIGKIINSLKPIYQDYDLVDYQKYYFEDVEPLNFNIKKSNLNLFNSISSSNFNFINGGNNGNINGNGADTSNTIECNSNIYSSNNAVLCKVCVYGNLQAFQWYLIKNPKLLDESIITSINGGNGNGISNGGGCNIIEIDDDYEFQFDNTPLTFAIENKNLNIIQWLINNYYLTKGLLNISLLKSIIIGDLELVNYFIDNDADVNCSVSSLEISPIHFAAKFNNLEILESLIQHGAKVEKKNKNGLSSIHYAARNQNKEILSFLIQNSKDPKQFINDQTNIGETALYFASTSNSKVNHEFCWYLINHFNSSTKCQIDGEYEIDIVLNYLKK